MRPDARAVVGSLLLEGLAGAEGDLVGRHPEVGVEAKVLPLIRAVGGPIGFI